MNRSYQWRLEQEDLLQQAIDKLICNPMRGFEKLVERATGLDLDILWERDEELVKDLAQKCLEDEAERLADIRYYEVW